MVEGEGSRRRGWYKEKKVVEGEEGRRRRQGWQKEKRVVEGEGSRRRGW